MALRAEFIRKSDDGETDETVGSALWDGSRVLIDGRDDHLSQALWRIFRPTAVAVDDPALRTAGTQGPVVPPPGSLAWFRAAAQVRAEPEGMRVRFIPESVDAVGWDPAGAYRPFSDTVERILRN
jgi:hypothetical protein